MEEGNLGLTLAVAAVLVGGTLLEALWVRGAWQAYFRLSLPLGAEPLPLATVPTRSEGETAGLGFRRVSDGVYLYWADRRRRAAPTLLHGVVDLVPSRKGCQLKLRWAPPWTPLLAAIWLMGLGVARGEAQVTVPIGCAMVFGIVVLYLRGARQAATELRYALDRGADREAAGASPG